MTATLTRSTRNARHKAGLRCWFGPWQWSDHWHGPAGHVGSIDLRSRQQSASPGKLEGFGLFVLPSHIHPGSEYELCSGAWHSQARLRWQSAFRTPGIDGNDLRSVLWETLTGHADPTGEDRVKPLVPTINLQYEIWLANRRIVTRPFRANGAEFRPVLDMLKREYRQHRNDSRNGLHPDERHYLRCLDFTREKYGLPYQAFIPSDLPDEGLLPHETTWTENWATAGTDITTGQNQTWSVVSGSNVTISAGLTAGSTNSSDRCETALSGSDNYCQATVSLTSVTTTRRSGPSCRFAAAANTSYIAMQNGGASSNGIFQAYKQTNAVYTALFSGVAGIAQAATKKITASGSTIEIFHGGASQESGTDTDHSVGIHAGMSFQNTTTSVLNLDNLEGGDLAAPSGNRRRRVIMCGSR